ncbi:hypothetical protein V8C86DRAFT_3150920 [Haematococcus lacustris]
MHVHEPIAHLHRRTARNRGLNQSDEYGRPLLDGDESEESTAVPNAEQLAGQQQGQQGQQQQQGQGQGQQGQQQQRVEARAGQTVLHAMTATRPLLNLQPAVSHVPGTLQGIDLKRGSQGRFAWLHSQLSQVVSAQCVDFSADRLSVRDGLTNSDLITFLDKERPQWSRVRWINIDGMSWDVIKALALKFDLHPLAVEDVIHIPQRIKADFYDHRWTGTNRDAAASAAFAPVLTTQPYAPLPTGPRPSNGANAVTYPPGTSVDPADLALPDASQVAISITPPTSSTPFASLATRTMTADLISASGTGPQGLSTPVSADHTHTQPPGRPAAPAQGQQQLAMQPEVVGPASIAHLQPPGTPPSPTPLGSPCWPQTLVSDPPGLPPPQVQSPSLVEGCSVSGVGAMEAPPRLLCRSGSMVHQRRGRKGGIPRLTTTLLSPLREEEEAARVTARCLSAGAGVLHRLSHCPSQGAQGGAGGPGGSVRRAAVQVTAEQVSLFLTNDGTLISMFQYSGQGVVGPLLGQLGESRTLVRDAQDASYLMNLVVDALVDHAYPVVDAYAQLIDEYEAKVMGGKPVAADTRELHVVQGDLAILKRTLTPALRLVSTLRSHSKEVAALAASSAARAPPAGSSSSSGGAAEGQALQAVASPAKKPPPLISHLTSTYLGDVQDHLSTLIDALDSQGEQCRDLIDLVFNLIAHGTNQSMQTLTVVSVLFLPLTFLAGIYGMNFDYLPELHWTYGYAYFYGACAIIVTLFLSLMRRLLGTAG